MSTDAPNAKLIHRMDLTPELCIVRVALDDGAFAAFEPGQFATIGLPPQGRWPHEPDGEAIHHHDPHEHVAAAMAAAAVAVAHAGQATGAAAAPAATRLVRRAYSIASAATGRDSLEFYLALVKEGRLTPHLWALQPGDPIWLDPRPHGKFTLAAVPHDADVVMVATGTGLAPYISMLRTYAGRGRWRRAALLHGVRLAADLGYRDELEALAGKDSTFTYLPCVTREPAESTWPGLRGRVTSLLTPDVFASMTGWQLDPARTHILLCGNPQMVDDASASLTNGGFQRPQPHTAGNLHFERYW